MESCQEQQNCPSIRPDPIETQALPLGPIESIEMKDVNFSYKDDPVIDKLNFSAKAGDRILIQGESGIGKSTILDILYGLISIISA